MAGIENEMEIAPTQMMEVNVNGDTTTDSDAGSRRTGPEDNALTEEKPVTNYSSRHPPGEGSSSADLKSEMRADNENIQESSGPEAPPKMTGNPVVEDPQEGDEPVPQFTIRMSAEDIQKVLISGPLQQINHSLKKHVSQQNQLANESEQPATEGGVLLQTVDIENVGGNPELTPNIYWEPLTREPDEATPIETSIEVLRDTFVMALSGNQEGALEIQISNILPTMEEIREYERSSSQLLDGKSDSCQTLKFSNGCKGVKFITSDGVPCFRALLQTYLMWNKIAQKIQQNLTTVPIASQIKSLIDESLRSTKQHLFNMSVKHIVVAEWGIVDPQMFGLAMSDVCACINGRQPTSGTMIRGRRKNLIIIKELIEHDSSL